MCTIGPNPATTSTSLSYPPNAHDAYAGLSRAPSKSGGARSGKAVASKSAAAAPVNVATMSGQVTVDNSITAGELCTAWCPNMYA